MNITYVNRRFLDYRVPVLAELNRLIDGRLHVIYSHDAVPERVRVKLTEIIGDRAIGMTNESRFGGSDHDRMANQGVILRYQPGLYSRILSTKPDVIVGEGFFKWTISAVATKIFRRVPLVVCYERTSYTERNVQWYRTLYRKAVLRVVDAICCNGTLCSEYVRSLGMPNDCITTGHMAADTVNLADQAANVTSGEIVSLRRKWKTAGTVIVYVGQLIPRKGLLEFLAGWKTFEKESPGSATLILVGNGPQSDVLKDYCTHNNLIHVHFAGGVDYDSITTVYAAADALVIPTLEDNWSLVVPEAMACGLPVLCSKYNGCWPELINEGVNGWIFNPYDPEDIVAKLRLVDEQKEKLPVMGEKSRQIVQDFSPENAALSILDACRMAVAR